MCQMGYNNYLDRTTGRSVTQFPPLILNFLSKSLCTQSLGINTFSYMWSETGNKFKNMVVNGLVVNSLIIAG